MASIEPCFIFSSSIRLSCNLEASALYFSLMLDKFCSSSSCRNVQGHRNGKRTGPAEGYFKDGRQGWGLALAPYVPLRPVLLSGLRQHP